MTHKLAVLLGILLAFCFTGCYRACVPNRNVTYLIPDTLIDFFPSSNTFISESHCVSKSGTIKVNCQKLNISSFHPVYYFETYKGISDDELLELQDTLSKMALIKANPMDTSLFILWKNYDLFKDQKDSTAICCYYKKLTDNSQVVPLFRDELYMMNEKYDTTPCALPVDYDLYVLRKGRKLVLPSKYLFEWNVLPESSRHGYSSGVALSKQASVIIYWAIAW